MSHKKNKVSLLEETIRRNKVEGKTPELSNQKSREEKVSLELDLKKLINKKDAVEYASVKIRADLYEKIRDAAEKRGVRQPGRFISLILEAYLDQAGE